MSSNDDPTVYDDADFAEYTDKLSGIYNDPTLTDAEKRDAVDAALEENLAEIDAADTVTISAEGTDDALSSMLDSAPAAPTASPTTSEETIVNDAYTPGQYPALDEISKAVEDLSSIGYDDEDTGNVVGDPSTASFGTTDTSPSLAEGVENLNAAIADAAATVDAMEAIRTGEAAEEPATESDPHNLGVTGVVDYVSPRDADRDGDVDFTHSRVDGIETITHYGDHGEITLVERDLDGNGTYESAGSLRPDGSIRVAEDRDDDGVVDLATFYDDGERFREDVIDSGTITETRFDTDGDDHPDVHLIDTDGDGRFDTANLDSDNDGWTNERLVDVDGDGRFDVRVSDDDNDGSLESTAISTLGDGSLGDISTFESLIPAEDSYHAQVGADVYDAPTTDSGVAGDLA